MSLYIYGIAVVSFVCMILCHHKGKGFPSNNALDNVEVVEIFTSESKRAGVREACDRFGKTRAVLTVRTPAYTHVVTNFTLGHLCLPCCWKKTTPTTS